MKNMIIFYNILDNNYKLNYSNYYNSEHFVNKFKIRCHHIFNFEPSKTSTIYEWNYI